jgi:hypothetical protein
MLEPTLPRLSCLGLGVSCLPTCPLKLPDCQINQSKSPALIQHSLADRILCFRWLSENSLGYSAYGPTVSSSLQLCYCIFVPYYLLFILLWYHLSIIAVAVGKIYIISIYLSINKKQAGCSRAAWAKGEPNGGRVENCAAINPAGELLDVSCSTQLGTACNIRPNVVLRMRGLAAVPSSLEETLDEEYVFVVNEINPWQSYFKGYTGTDIVCGNWSSCGSSSNSCGSRIHNSDQWKVSDWHITHSL